MNKTLVEINIVAPFLSKKNKSVNFYLGSLESYFSSPLFSEIHQMRTPTLFLASNFINVFKPDDAWSKLSKIASHMKEGNLIGLTTLSSEQADALIESSKSSVYSYGDEEDGIRELRQNNSFYKSVVFNEFTNFAKTKLGTTLVATAVRTSRCKILKSDGKYTYADIMYNVTIMRKL